MKMVRSMAIPLWEWLRSLRYARRWGFAARSPLPPLGAAVRLLEPQAPGAHRPHAVAEPGKSQTTGLC